MILLTDLARMEAMQNTAEKYEGDDEKVALITMVRELADRLHEVEITHAFRNRERIGTEKFTLEFVQRMDELWTYVKQGHKPACNTAARGCVPECRNYDPAYDRRRPECRAREDAERERREQGGTR